MIKNKLALTVLLASTVYAGESVAAQVIKQNEIHLASDLVQETSCGDIAVSAAGGTVGAACGAVMEGAKSLYRSKWSILGNGLVTAVEGGCLGAMVGARIGLGFGGLVEIIPELPVAQYVGTIAGAESGFLYGCHYGLIYGLSKFAGKAALSGTLAGGKEGAKRGSAMGRLWKNSGRLIKMAKATCRANGFDRLSPKFAKRLKYLPFQELKEVTITEDDLNNRGENPKTIFLNGNKISSENSDRVENKIDVSAALAMLVGKRIAFKRIQCVGE